MMYHIMEKHLTLKVPIMTTSEDTFCGIFFDFGKK